MIVYQKDMKKSSAVKCGRGDFWREVKSQKTQWHIDARRAVKAAVEASKTEGVAAIQTWLDNTDYQKFLLSHPRNLKSKRAKEAFAKKSDEQKLLAWADILKQELTAFIFSCYLFDEVKRKKKRKDETEYEVVERPRQLKYCHLNGLVMLDIDHVGNPMEIWYKLREMKELMERVALVHISCSGDGLRIIFTADINEGNLADNQIVFANALGVGYKPDRSCIDACRTSFAPKENEILYINEELLFNYYDEEFDKRYTPLYRKKKTQPLHHKFADTASKDTLSAGSNTAGTDPLRLTSQTQLGQSPDVRPDVRQSQNVQSSIFNLQSLKWRGYDLQGIIDARYGDKLPCRDDSNRHTESLKLATDLMLMLDGDKALVQRIVEAQPWVQEIIEERDENVEQTVESAAGCVAEKEKKYAGSLPSKAMLEAVKNFCGRSYQEILKGVLGEAKRQSRAQGVLGEPSDQGRAQDVTESDMDRYLWDWGEQIEGLFEDFPIMKDVCKGLKRNQYPAALVVAGGLMMTLMTRCTYRFYHRPEELRRLNNSTLIIGDPASGKSFATRLFKLLMAPMIKADEAGREAINAYREEVKAKGANKEKPKKPKVLYRIHPARTSNAQFIQDMVNAKENVDGVDMQLHMLTFDTELDNTLTLQKGGAYIDKQSLELKAFHNEEDGQAYSNVDSVLQNFIVTWNYIYTGTPIALKKKVNQQNFGSGLATRLTCIPLPATNFEMMARENIIDVDSDKRLTEWAEKLDRMKGELTVQKIVDELYDWTARRMEDAKENDSKADEMLLKRCAYHGLNFSAPFIVMRHWDKMHQEGNYWCGEFETDEVDWRLAELIVNMQFACQRHYFGAMAEAYFDNKLREAAVNVPRRQKTLDGFSRLPDEFTAEDVMKYFTLTNINAARTRIKRLQKDHLIEKSGEYVEDGKVKNKYSKTGKIML